MNLQEHNCRMSSLDLLKQVYLKQCWWYSFKYKKYKLEPLMPRKGDSLADTSSKGIVGQTMYVMYIVLLLLKPSELIFPFMLSLLSRRFKRTINSRELV